MAILIKPILTEKATSSNDKGKFSFIVDRKANKVQVKKAVEKTYDVNVVSVNTINVLGKSVSKFTKTGIVSGRKPSYKKAIVQLKEGEFIDFYSQISLYSPKLSCLDFIHIFGNLNHLDYRHLIQCLFLFLRVRIIFEMKETPPIEALCVEFDLDFLSVLIACFFGSFILNQSCYPYYEYLHSCPCTD